MSTYIKIRFKAWWMEVIDLQNNIRITKKDSKKGILICALQKNLLIFLKRNKK